MNPHSVCGPSSGPSSGIVYVLTAEMQHGFKRTNGLIFFTWQWLFFTCSCLWWNLSHVTIRTSLKPPSFVCITSEVRALCFASCFEVCQTTWTMLFLLLHSHFLWECSSHYLALATGLDWFCNLAPGCFQLSSHYIYLAKINSWESGTDLV